MPIISEFRLTDHIFLRLSKTQARIGVAEFNNIKNPYSFLFDRRTSINFTDSPDVHISQILFEQLKSFGDFGEHENFYLRFNINDERSIRNLKAELGFKNGNKIILVNLFTEQRQKRISLDKIIELVKQLSSFGEYQFCLIDGKRKSNFKIINKHISEDLIFIHKDDYRNLLNLLNFSSLAITCDSEFMHIAGVVGVPQISIFGPSNPFNLAPIGPKKIFIRKSDLIDDIEVEDIFSECKKLLNIDN
ncbi:MAG: hypothetical protein H6613_02695 [Ignavibacteriales bacterium]|nr:hypothetical protein [Ignavibacteriales bacterium]